MRDISIVLTAYYVQYIRQRQQPWRYLYFVATGMPGLKCHYFLDTIQYFENHPQGSANS